MSDSHSDRMFPIACPECGGLWATTDASIRGATLPHPFGCPSRDDKSVPELRGHYEGDSCQFDFGPGVHNLGATPPNKRDTTDEP